jgi:hypothetical protein
MKTIGWIAVALFLVVAVFAIACGWQASAILMPMGERAQAPPAYPAPAPTVGPAQAGLDGIPAPSESALEWDVFNAMHKRHLDAMLNGMGEINRLLEKPMAHSAGWKAGIYRANAEITLAIGELAYLTPPGSVKDQYAKELDALQYCRRAALLLDDLASTEDWTRLDEWADLGHQCTVEFDKVADSL